MANAVARLLGAAGVLPPSPRVARGQAARAKQNEKQGLTAALDSDSSPDGVTLAASTAIS